MWHHDAGPAVVALVDGDAVEIVGPTLRTEHYGIALPSDSELVEPVNRALLRVTGSVAYDRLVDGYFG